MSVEWYLSISEFVTDQRWGADCGFSFLHLTWFLHPRCTLSDAVWSVPPPFSWDPSCITSVMHHIRSLRVLRYEGFFYVNLIGHPHPQCSRCLPEHAFTKSTHKPPRVSKANKGNSILRITLSFVWTPTPFPYCMTLSKVFLLIESCITWNAPFTVYRTVFAPSLSHTASVLFITI